MPTNPTENIAERDPKVARFIESFHTYLEDLQNADEPFDVPKDTVPTTYEPAPPGEAHVLPLKIPPEMWQMLQKRCPYRGITRFILAAIQEKLQREK